ncbi:unnamed protein product, partial [Iphiclides podalirius]
MAYHNTTYHIALSFTVVVIEEAGAVIHPCWWWGGLTPRGSVGRSSNRSRGAGSPAFELAQPQSSDTEPMRQSATRRIFGIIR